MIFLSISCCGAHFISEVRRNQTDQDNLFTKLSALNVDFSSPSLDPYVERVLCRGGVTFGYSFKTRYYIIARCTLIPPVAAPMRSRLMHYLRLLVLIAPDWHRRARVTSSIINNMSETQLSQRADSADTRLQSCCCFCVTSHIHTLCC